jgi:tellurite methyltransferase
MSDLDRQKWQARYRDGDHQSAVPSPLLDRIAELLPNRGRALDVAGGAGRNALWLARRGLDVTLVDIASAGLAIARARAEEANLPLDVLALDLETTPLPTGPWDVITSFMFLDRKVFAQVADTLAPGGVVVLLQPTLVNLERHARPPRAFLLEPGEAETLFGDLENLHHFEGWTDDGSHEAHLVAQKPR